MNNGRNVLLAKSIQGTAPVDFASTLVGHTRRVCEMAAILVDSLAEDFGRTFALQSQDVATWKKTVLIAAWLHDLGKAGDHFQKAVRSSSFRQGVRHEKLSLAVAIELGSWLQPLWEDLPDWHQPAVLMAVAGHHLKFPDEIETDRCGTEVTVYLDHPDFRETLQIGCGLFGLCEPSMLRRKVYSLLRRGDLRKLVDGYISACEALGPAEKRIVAATKATLMCADLAGSALPAKIENPDEWLRERIGRLLSESGLGDLVQKRLKGNPPREFQVAVAQCKGLTTLVEAGCGGGKTAAAYMWAANHADSRRLFFCYPTTGTASEGFSGYMREPDFDALLVHGRAQIDYRLLANMPSRNQESDLLKQLALEAMELWPNPAVVCTAHTVLGVMENVRRGIYAWPSLARSAFVFDEVHAFSEKLFTYLLRFLAEFTGAPALLMTATLPTHRRRALEAVCEKRGGIQIVEGPVTREHAKRYVLFKEDKATAKEQALKTMNAGGKVLWVCNTVARAMNTLDEFARIGVNAQPYHSRYRYQDRLVRQRQVIDGFLPEAGAMIAVTTQVAEMSLDLSADLLVSEFAPVPSMIQRLGRLNRFEETPKEMRTGLFIEPERSLPYGDDDLVGLPQWLDSVCGGHPVSQGDLADAFCAHAGNQQVPEPVAYCHWMDGEWNSLKDRDIEEAGYNIEVVRRCDLGERSAVEMAIPMPFPKGNGWKDWDRVGRFLVVPDGLLIYDQFRGATWNNS